MFGETLDHALLRVLAHADNRATEEELNSAHASSIGRPDDIVGKLPKILSRFGGHFPIDPALSYLDMGCGSGELTIGLARLGVRDITGVDFLPRFLAGALTNARAAGVGGEVRFVCADLRTWRPERRYDVLISFDALEHIDRPLEFLERMADFLAPGGRAILSFGPLFHSPFGDHMAEFFRLQLPWRGALFSEGALLRVRREYYRPTDPAARYQEIAGGLNLMRYSEFLRHVAASGWRFDYLDVNTFLANRALKALSNCLIRTPVIRDFVVHNVYTVLRRCGAR